MAREADDLIELVAAGAFEEARARARRDDLLPELAATLPAAVARTGYPEVDLDLVRLIEDVLDSIDGQRARARLQTKLAFELRGDPTAAARCQALLEQAELACDGDGLAADVLLTRLHVAETGPAEEREALADRVIALARSDGNTEVELQGRLARFHALLDLRQVVDAEAELGRCERLGGSSADVRAFVESRRAMLSTLRGAYDDALGYIHRAVEAARSAGMPDADRMDVALRGVVSVERGEMDDIEAAMPVLHEMIRLAPGQLFEATLARVERACGHESAARTALARARPALRDGRSVRWSAGACDAAHVAAALGPLDHVAELHAALLPHADAETFVGPTYSGSVLHALAALEVRLGHVAEAIAHARLSVARYDAMAAVAWGVTARGTLADALDRTGSDVDVEEARQLRDRARQMAADIGMAIAPPSTTTELIWYLARDDQGWTLETAGESARLPLSRGLDVLAALVASPRREISALVLDGGDPALADRALPILDDDARLAYRARLADIDALLVDADAAGDAAASDRLAVERDALLSELRRASGLGGRHRQSGGDAERARVNVTRNVKRAIDRIGQGAPAAAHHLTTSIRTGLSCRYEPDGTGPDRWQVVRD